MNLLQTVYLNWKGPQGRETVDEFTRDPGQTFRQFNEYLAAMMREYALTGMSVYRSSRPCRGWRQESNNEPRARAYRGQQMPNRLDLVPTGN